jgi:hypothetical protein
MLSPLRFLLPLALACLAGCPVWEPLANCADYDACDPTDGSSSGPAGTLPTTSASEDIQTVTGTSDAGGSSTTNTEDSTETGSTGQPADLPAIVHYELKPDPITTNGPLAVIVNADHASGVRMDTGLGDIIELTPQPQPGLFIGEIAVISGALNGPHEALLTAWENTVDGDTVAAPYEIALPTPGTEKLWETGDLIGPGRVVAMATLPTGELVELGHHSPDGEQRCYLRLRDKDGLWAPADVVDVLPGTPCEAIDLKIDDQGEVFVLVHQQTNNELRWRLLKLPAWGESAKHMGLGAKNEIAVALAHHDSGMVAVCGTAPSGALDELDAMAQIFRPGVAVEPWKLDYLPENKQPHSFTEQTRDCVFAGETLVLVGAAYGPHEQEQKYRDRLFMLRVDTAASLASWSVAAAGDKTQSAAQAVDVDDEGRLVVGGYTCDDECKPLGDLRVYDERGSLAHQVSLGTFPTEQFAVQDVAYNSPAGYIVVATGGTQGNETAFTVRAFAPGEQEAALWTFTRKDLQVLHFAMALAIGDYGEVYAGGFGANGYPAVAFIAS